MAPRPDKAGKDLPAETPSVENRSHTRGLRRGNPGNKGGGRKPEVYKKWLGSLLDSEAHRREFAAATKDRTDPAFQFATKHAAEHAHGRPAQPITGADGQPLTIRLVRE